MSWRGVLLFILFGLYTSIAINSEEREALTIHYDSWVKGNTNLETDIDARITLLLQVKWVDLRSKNEMF